VLLLWCSAARVPVFWNAGVSALNYRWCTLALLTTADPPH
jgi:hypothetical protein